MATELIDSTVKGANLAGTLSDRRRKQEEYQANAPVRDAMRQNALRGEDARSQIFDANDDTQQRIQELSESSLRMERMWSQEELRKFIVDRDTTAPSRIPTLQKIMENHPVEEFTYNGEDKTYANMSEDDKRMLNREWVQEMGVKAVPLDQMPPEVQEKWMKRFFKIRYNGSWNLMDATEMVGTMNGLNIPQIKRWMDDYSDVMTKYQQDQNQKAANDEKINAASNALKAAHPDGSTLEPAAPPLNPDEARKLGADADKAEHQAKSAALQAFYDQITLDARAGKTIDDAYISALEKQYNIDTYGARVAGEQQDTYNARLLGALREADLAGKPLQNATRALEHDKTILELDNARVKNDPIGYFKNTTVPTVGEWAKQNPELTAEWGVPTGEGDEKFIPPLDSSAKGSSTFWGITLAAGNPLAQQIKPELQRVQTKLDNNDNMKISTKDEKRIRAYDQIVGATSTYVSYKERSDAASEVGPVDSLENWMAQYWGLSENENRHIQAMFSNSLLSAAATYNDRGVQKFTVEHLENSWKLGKDSHTLNAFDAAALSLLENTGMNYRNEVKKTANPARKILLLENLALIKHNAKQIMGTYSQRNGNDNALKRMGFHVLRDDFLEVDTIQMPATLDINDAQIEALRAELEATKTQKPPESKETTTIQPVRTKPGTSPSTKTFNNTMGAVAEQIKKHNEEERKRRDRSTVSVNK